MASWSVTKKSLSPPSLYSLVPLIKSGLDSNFNDVSAEVVDCPDLRQDPFNLAAEGLSGNERIADIGSQSNLAPVPNFTKKYSLTDMVGLMEMDKGNSFLIGAGAGPFHVVGVNSELAPNMSYRDGELVNLTHYSKIDAGGRCLCERIDSTDFGLMANLFGSDGKPGKVLKIIAKIRTGKLNFTAAIQEALKAHFGEQAISIGGVFVIRKGKANLHVMPDFSKTPLKSRQEVEEWLRFFDMSAPLVCLSVFHTYDPGLGLRMEHTHCFSKHNEGGHYHDDTTPDEVEYEAYFNVAEAIYRIDRPES